MTMTLQIASKRHPHAFGSCPRRWVAERTFAWISASPPNSQTKTKTRRNEAISARNDRASRPCAA